MLQELHWWCERGAAMRQFTFHRGCLVLLPFLAPIQNGAWRAVGDVAGRRKGQEASRGGSTPCSLPKGGLFAGSATDCKQSLHSLSLIPNTVPRKYGDFSFSANFIPLKSVAPKSFSVLLLQFSSQRSWACLLLNRTDKRSIDFK